MLESTHTPGKARHDKNVLMIKQENVFRQLQREAERHVEAQPTKICALTGPYEPKASGSTTGSVQQAIDLFSPQRLAPLD